jgi:hypothetical protein
MCPTAVGTAMLRRLRETAPAGLVPLAWGFAVAAHLSLVAPRTVLVAHVVMDVLLAGFAVLSWADMREGVLRVWWWVVAVGFLLTLVGTWALARPAAPETLATVTVVGWAVLPAAGLAYTGRHVDAGRWVNLGGAALSVVGGGVYLAGVATAPDAPLAVAGLVLVGVGQTAGIVDAVVRY